ncbi:uncharacterized protein LOC123317390 isoform X2 [Coccinella septempunctata]|uniref:uncharacterized protein LOC123317390 isoform X2 n=1 Tax=Coccinella septempunctata TaxID=41139 RepID=UPI001D082741|nr:uncharacterized protein LOC123317390 isoform X2 [Coccinella septempunctata]
MKFEFIVSVSFVTIAMQTKMVMGLRLILSMFYINFAASLLMGYSGDDKFFDLVNKDLTIAHRGNC